MPKEPCYRGKRALLWRQKSPRSPSALRLRVLEAEGLTYAYGRTCMRRPGGLSWQCALKLLYILRCRGLLAGRAPLSSFVLRYYRQWGVIVTSSVSAFVFCVCVCWYVCVCVRRLVGVYKRARAHTQTHTHTHTHTHTLH